ncbi:MAG: hypothetical protein JXQ83_00775 [Candidatus Glassbacteria bacterium]|nr:hypothetical protein [Candidatus Glassbacteria bacterium]
MRCKQIAKQTEGEIAEVELEGLVCSQAEICRRKGICVLSPYSRPEPLKQEKGPENRVETQGGDAYPGYYEILRFKKSLGFQWVGVESFEEAVRATQNRPGDEDHPRLIRRVEFFKLPDGGMYP